VAKAVLRAKVEEMLKILTYLEEMKVQLRSLLGRYLLAAFLLASPKRNFANGQMKLGRARSLMFKSFTHFKNDITMLGPVVSDL